MAEAATWQRGAADLQVHESGLRSHAAVPKVVVHGLEHPAHPARREVQGKHHQAIGLAAAITLGFGLLSIGFNDPLHPATAFGLRSAGLAFAMQHDIGSIAGWFALLRGSSVTVGDRISMGGVCGDMMRPGCIQTTISSSDRWRASHGHRHFCVTAH